MFRPQELLIEANMNQFRCVKPQKSEHTMVRRDLLAQISKVTLLIRIWAALWNLMFSVSFLICWLCHVFSKIIHLDTWVGGSELLLLPDNFVLQEVMTQIQMDLDSKLKFNSFQASGLPPSNKVEPF